MTETPDPARAQFFTLSLIRFSGVALAFIAVTILAKRLVEPAELVGGILLAVAAFEVLVLPMLLVRRWRRRDR